MIINRYINEIPAQKTDIIKGEFVCAAFDAAVQRIRFRNESDIFTSSDKNSVKRENK